MADLVRKLKKLLLENGCSYVRSGRGDHKIWYNALSNRNFTVDRGILSRNMANEVLKQTGLPKAF